jgi:rRNA-processing protein FCF1
MLLMAGYMLDSNVFDKLAEEPTEFINELRNSLLQGLRLYITRVQEFELNQIPDLARRDLIASVATTVSPEVAVSSAVYDVSTYDDPMSVYASTEQAAAQNALAKGNFEAHGKDAVIAGTALRRKMTLVTEDGRMTKRALELGIPTLRYAAFRSKVLRPRAE